MTTGGRTTWWPMDAAWHRRELMVELGESFEASGPFVMVVLSGWAQEQRNSGVVRGGFKVLAREAFVTPSYARSIVEEAGSIGALDDLEIDEDGRRFSCRVSGWQADQARGRAALRMAQKRADAGETPLDDDPEPDEQDVTDENVFGSVRLSALPNQTKEKEELLPPTPKGGNRQRDRLFFDEEVQAYTRALGIEHEEGWQNVRGAIESGKARTNDEVLAWVRKHRPDVLPQELVA